MAGPAWPAQSPGGGAIPSTGQNVAFSFTPGLTNNVPSWLATQALPWRINGDKKWIGYQAILDRIRTNCTTFTNRAALGSNTVDATLISMISNSAAGTCICLSNGVYNIGTNELLTLTNGVSLIGQSMSNTIITWFSNGPNQNTSCRISNNTSLINLTVWSPAGLWFNQCITGGGSNMFLGNVLCIGDTDTIRFDLSKGGAGKSQMFNVAAYGHWDSIFPSQGSATAESFMLNCYSFADDTSVSGSYDGNTRAMRTGQGRLTCQWCTLEVTNTARAVTFAIDCVEVDANGAYGIFHECTFIDNPVGSGFNPPLHIENANNTPQNVSGGVYDATKFTANKVFIFP